MIHSYRSRTASGGREALIPDLLAALRKCRKLNVAIRSAIPLTAVSRIISSSGSDNTGRHEKT